MSPIIKCLISFVIGLIVGLISVLFINYNNKTVIDQDLAGELDSLARLDSINKIIIDSLYSSIDSSEIRIKYIKVEYEKEFDVITDQSVSADIEFFRNYISNFNK